MIKSKLVVIGGSDAGISASLRARELSPDTEVDLVLADRYPNFSICGLPFYLSGEVPDWKNLAHRTADEIEAKGIRLFPDHRVTAIIPDRKHILATDVEGRGKTFPYDRLLVGTGGVSHMAKIGKLQDINVDAMYRLDFDKNGKSAVAEGNVASHVFDIVWPAQSAILKGKDYDIMPNSCSKCHAFARTSGDLD